MCSLNKWHGGHALYLFRMDLLFKYILIVLYYVHFCSFLYSTSLLWSSLNIRAKKLFQSWLQTTFYTWIHNFTTNHKTLLFISFELNSKQGVTLHIFDWMETVSFLRYTSSQMRQSNCQRNIHDKYTKALHATKYGSIESMRSSTQLKMENFIYCTYSEWNWIYWSHSHSFIKMNHDHHHHHLTMFSNKFYRKRDCCEQKLFDKFR